jgi:hypothetical protein
MKIKFSAFLFIGIVLFSVPVFFAESASAQGPLQMVTEYVHRHSDSHAGVHSGLWTFDRQQILEEESKDPHRNCTLPYCNRCSKHLADYGHEYQFIDGPSQRQLWYRATAGSIAHSTQRCYDEHGCPYARRGQPAAVMSWEYQRYLNHAVSDQIKARNAVAAEETAERRVAMLDDLLKASAERKAVSEAIWKKFEAEGQCVECSPCNADYCRAKAQFLKDAAYVEDVALERNAAIAEWKTKSAYADERVRLALLLKDDADKATRFMRIHHKPPKWQDVLALQKTAQEMAEAKKDNTAKSDIGQ